MKQITITVSKSGQVSIDAEGFLGQSCKDATAAFEDALGASSKDSQEKPEIYMTDTQRVGM